MLVLTINAGSSSLKLSVVDSVSGRRCHNLQVTGIAAPLSRLIVNGVVSAIAPGISHGAALQIVLKELATVGFALDQVAAAGHRVVHGGEAFTHAVLIDDEVERSLAAATALAPLHNPANLAAIRALRAALPTIPHVAVFDTSFHATLPRRARTYALPPALQSQLGLRRFGFHGISHGWVAHCAARHLGAPLDSLRLVTCHLGHGASITAVEFGRSIDTSMGMTPLEGLVMGTRAGDIDAGILLRLQRTGMSTDELERLLNFESGLLGMTGSSDVAAIEQRAAQGDDSCRLALHVFTQRIRRYIGAMSVIVGGPDAIVFSGGIGENSPYIRHRATRGLDFIGAHLDEDLNRAALTTADTPVVRISTDASRVQLLVAAADEDLAISADVAQFLQCRPAAPRSQEHIPIAISGRHVHLCQKTVDALFGPGYSLTPQHALAQPGQFAAAETVTLIGPRGQLAKVRIVGPTRDADQIEISRSDEFVLGVDAPIRLSGRLEGTPGITLRGPLHTITLRHGVICSHRHIHMTSADATRLGVSHGDVVVVAVHGTQRSLDFGDVLVRVSAVAKLEMHIDTDEANAAGLVGGAEGEFVHSHLTATLAEKVLP